MFRQINTLYQIIKGGIHTPPRRRSLLNTYVDTVCGWDNERTMLKAMGVVERPYVRRHPEGRYVRGLLGLPEAYRFGTHENAEAVWVRHNTTGAPMTRLPSPLFIKVIGDRVYLVAGPVFWEAYGARFSFRHKENGRYTVLKAPTREELGEDFLHRFLAYCSHRLSGPHNLLWGLAYMEGIELKEVAE